MNGNLLGNRYELIEKIGGGGMAIVYKARCRLLNRFVAVKILRPEFVNDEEFVKRFLIEAQSAASLSHPNIVSIYDVGNEDDIRYIVMEYIDGITLKDYINENGPLDWREALNIGIQICSAIEHAHKKLIVHRDIKPQNILMTREGIAKVADFGIARAVSSSTITVVGSTIGSVHYFSPEQARGGYTDEKSDLYSLGIVIYEMVTGRLPFNGDTPVAVALKHIQSTPVEPARIREGIPASVNDIIMKAIQKDQNIRYQSASEMLSDLCQALKEPDGDFVVMNQNDDEFPTRRIDAVNDKHLRPMREKPKSEGNPVEVKNKKKDKMAVIFAVITSLIIITIFTYLGYSIVIPQMMPSNKFTVGDYRGKDYDLVKRELENARIPIKEKWVYDEKIGKNIIISQSISPNQEINPGSLNEIELEISRGPELVKIPDVKKMDYRTAEIQLEDMKLKTIVVEEFDEVIASGLVIRTEPAADTEVTPGTTVTIIKSIGPELRQTLVPDLTDKTRKEAQQMIADAKLKLGRMEPQDMSSVVDRVVRQDPLPGSTVEEGTPVNLYFETPAEEVNGGIDNGNNDGGADSVVNIKKIKTAIVLSNPDAFGKTIKTYIEATPVVDNATTEIILSKDINKDDFPISVKIPVPENGKSWVRVFFNDQVYYEYYLDDKGR